MEIEELLDERIDYWRKETVDPQSSKDAIKLADIIYYELSKIKKMLSQPKQKQEIAEFPEHIVKYLDACNSRNKPLIEVIGKAKYHDPDYIYWTEEETRNIAIAYSTGNYTVKKEPLYYVVLKNTTESSANRCYLWLNKRTKKVFFNLKQLDWTNNGTVKNTFLKKEIAEISNGAFIDNKAFEIVPVEEEME